MKLTVPLPGIPKNRSRPIFPPAAYNQQGRRKAARKDGARPLPGWPILSRSRHAGPQDSWGATPCRRPIHVFPCVLDVLDAFPTLPVVLPSKVREVSHLLILFASPKKFLNILLKALHRCTPEAFYSIFSEELMGCSAGCNGVQRKRHFERCTPYFCQAATGFFANWCRGATLSMSRYSF